jgi:hypothetical protein
MNDFWKHLTVDDIALILAIAGTVLFSVFAARAEMRLWGKVRNIESRRQQQRAITEGKAHLR